MARLFVDDTDVAEVEIAGTSRKRLLGLLKHESLQGALLLPRTNSVHTFGMKFAIDVAFCDRKSNVVSVVTMKPNRLSMPRLRAKYVVEAAEGAFEQWGVVPGVKLTTES